MGTVQFAWVDDVGRQLDFVTAADAMKLDDGDADDWLKERDQGFADSAQQVDQDQMSPQTGSDKKLNVAGLALARNVLMLVNLKVAVNIDPWIATSHRVCEYCYGSSGKA